MKIIRSIESEWIKQRNSTTFWLILAGGLFMPLVLGSMHMLFIRKLGRTYFAPDFWLRWYLDGWELMARLLLPMVIILSASLTAQLEYRNNTWKQLHTTPQGLSTIFMAKLLVVLCFILQMLVVFMIAMFIAGSLPIWFYGHIPQPNEVFPWQKLLSIGLTFYVLALPMIALQYLFSLYFKNYIIPLILGIFILGVSITALPWKYAYLLPYNYGAIYIKQLFSKNHIQNSEMLNLYLALGYFILFVFLAFSLYRTKKEKG